MVNAVIQDAFLGRGTNSPILSIVNQMGLQSDENAPQSVSDEIMEMIGPSRAVDRLEQASEQLRILLTEKYGRPSRATAEEREQYKKTQTSLRAARQDHRRKVYKMIYKDHFKKKNEEELQNQLKGIYKPQAVRRIVHKLPERNHVATILGDLDEDLSEEEIVRRKIEAINAMVAYAFVCEPRQPRKRKRVHEPSTQDQEPKRSSSQATSTQEGPSVNVMVSSQSNLPKLVCPVISEVPATPPPPYSSLDLDQPTLNEAVRKKQRRAPDPCIFCRKKYTRTSSLWNHLEAHLERANGGWVKCPACSIGCNSPKAFMAHAARSHQVGFRRPRVKLVRRELQ